MLPAVVAVADGFSRAADNASILIRTLKGFKAPGADSGGGIFGLSVLDIAKGVDKRLGGSKFQRPDQRTSFPGAFGLPFQQQAGANIAGPPRAFGVTGTDQFRFGGAKAPIVKGLTTGLQQREIDARLAGSRDQLKGILTEEAKFLEDALEDVRLKPADKLAIKNALLGVNSEIDGINSAIKSDADAKTDAAKAAAEQIRAAASQIPLDLQGKEIAARLSGSRTTLKGILAKEAEALANTAQKFANDPETQNAINQALLGVLGELESIDQSILADAEAKREAIKKVAAEFKSQAEDVKSAVLRAFDFKQESIDVAREFEDAKKELLLANRIGGAEGHKLAQRRFDDAKLAVARQAVERTQFRVTEGPKGPVNTLNAGPITININGDTDPEQTAKHVIAALNRARKHGVHQFSGTQPNHNTMT